ncbi:MAG TPA: NUDIX domain-containing protein [Candidatus Saccharimonadales bacterium]
MNPQTTPEQQYEVLDENGHKTGELLDKSVVHKGQLWHEVVNVWVINSRQEILMQLRAPGVELSPNVWDVTTGTHLRPGEVPVLAALRTLQTELGINTAAESLRHLFNIQSANPMPNGMLHKVFGHVYLLRDDADINALTFDKEKISQLAWVPMMKLMADVGNEETKKNYFPRANDYYPQLFEAFQAWL